MMKYLKLFALFLMIVFYSFCNAQNKTDLPTGNTNSESNDVITSYGPNSITRNIIQDRNGHIWIASFKGIFRYDGKSFTNISSKVSSARFFSVLEDRKGHLWFGSIGSGVYYYDGKSFQNYTTKDGLASDQVGNIYEDKTGKIWFGTDGGASRYDGKSFRSFKMSEVPPVTQADSVHQSIYQQPLPEVHWMHNDVNSIIEDKKGKFWFGTRGHAFVYDARLPDGQGKTFTTLTHEGIPFRNVRTIIEDKKGNIWLGGADGLWRYDGSTFINFTKNFVGYVYEDKKGNIWTSSESDSDKRWALFRYDGKTLSNKKPTVTELKSEYEGNKGMIFGILEANDGSIWFGSMQGLYRYDGNTITDFKDKESQK